MYENMWIDCIVITLVLGIVPIIEKYAIHHIDAETYIIVSGTLFFLFVVLYHFLIGHSNLLKDLQTIRDNQHLALLIVFSSFLFFIVNNYLNLSLLKKKDAFLVTAITSSFPIFTALFGVLLLNESISYNHFMGIVVVLFGVLILNTADSIPDISSVFS